MNQPFDRLAYARLWRFCAAVAAMDCIVGVGLLLAMRWL